MSTCLILHKNVCILNEFPYFGFNAFIVDNFSVFSHSFYTVDDTHSRILHLSIFSVVGYPRPLSDEA